ncbi:MAG: 30S ribosomal protein S16 [Paludibacteraceae bacterium]|jgi:small subunit ribosomal protein S16|nr:30S ribosomal protein S16 [Paludibacteraceae bacterium]MDI9537472.1 30S ribosomal protein S16 [Bacteroidota bacterium]OQC34498.1 MAG: 30S ribosomal protein S16 [Bacteroidetes bacterium ADurb.Bin057]HHT61535.1 30S ribosomal protein S16 [Bacteroidales bacterium]MBP9039842.1 30S ribosomal protein S16 [Paludibacteraceae bacterium]
MATKIRLQRHGRKGYAYYHIVIADSRAPRDGRFIERIGSYNPNTDPATIDLNFERALYWVNVGAQPTDTVRNILSNEGVMLMKHLQGGVKKGAFDEAAAQKKFDAWKADKEKVLAGISEKNKSAEAAKVKARLDAEKAINKARAAELSKKRMEALEAEAAAAAEAAKEAAAETETEAKAEETSEVSETPEAPAAE